jgi:hypothetical protein
MARVWVLTGLGFTAVLAAWGQSAPAPVAPPTLGVFMEFDAAPAGSVVGVMQHEVDDLLKPAGIAVHWRLASENHGDETYVRLVVLRFDGNCQAGDFKLPLPGSDAEPPETAVSLGDTKVANGRVLPYTVVRCDEVRKALMYLPAASREQRQVAMGVALGRVVAHELYHVLARTTGHAMHGLAKASHPLPELVSGRGMKFDDRASAAIRNGFVAQE